MRFFLLNVCSFTLFSYFVEAQVLAPVEPCREQYIKRTIKRLNEQEGKTLSVGEYEARKKTAPNVSYVEELAVSTCEIENVKSVLLSADFASLCPSIKTPYRLRCIREWIGQHRFSNSAELTVLMAIIPPAGIEDKKLPYVNHQMVMTQLIDTVLFTFERIDLANFYVNRMGTEHPNLKDEIKDLQKAEVEFVEAMPKRLIPNLEGKIKILKDESGREPAGDLNVRQWIKGMIPKMEKRLQNIKNKKW